MLGVYLVRHPSWTHPSTLCVAVLDSKPKEINIQGDCEVKLVLTGRVTGVTGVGVEWSGVEFGWLSAACMSHWGV